MERYEINKYFESFKTKIKDLYIALKIAENAPRLEELEKEISQVDFWNDQNRAQKIIQEANLLKEKKEDYYDLEKEFANLKELDEISLVEEEYALILEEEILAFVKKLNEIEEKSLLSGKYDACDCILEIHPGAGGTESMDWADMLHRMYLRFCAKNNFKVRTLDFQAGDEAGIKSVTLEIKGKYAYGLLKSERGVHRLVRISPFDSNKRRHTSFASCDISPMITERTEIKINDDDLKIDVFHSSGAGGQSVNTTDSAVRITHKPSGIVVTCQNERSQLKNREVAMNVLKSKLLELEIRRQEALIKNIKGEQMDIGFGSQIRSYVFCPYTLVKDHRTLEEVGNVEAVMDGEIKPFIDSFLRKAAGEMNEQ